MTLRTYLNWERLAVAADRKMVATLLVGVCTVVLITVAQDFLRAYIKGSSFYLSESVLFSSFWWLFAPLLLAQYILIKRRLPKRLREYGLLITVPLGIHLLAFPSLVWIISQTAYEHTFRFGQTLGYTLAEHVYQLVILYSVFVFGYSHMTRKADVAKKGIEIEPSNRPHPFLNTLLVSEGGKKLTIALQDIVYFSAESPYIGIYTSHKKYLYPDRLKSMATKIPPGQFVRIHKSTIVNISQVVSYASRLNGDYDLTLKSGAKLRVSRSFAAEFKYRFHPLHPLTS